MSQINIQIISPNQKSSNHHANSFNTNNTNNKNKQSFQQNNQKRSASVTRISSRSISLSQEFIYQVLGQQYQFKKHKSKENLTRLIQYYRKFVEYYSEKNDKIFIYFMDKISNLSTQVPNMTQSDQKITMSMSRQIALQVQPQGDRRFSSSKSITITPPKYDPQMKKIQRSKNAQIAIQVSKIKKRANARTILNSYYQQCLQNNILVANNLQNQRKNLQQKLMAIHKKSMQNASKVINKVSQSSQFKVIDQKSISNQKYYQREQKSQNINQNSLIESPTFSKDQKQSQNSNSSPVPMLQFSFNSRKGFLK